MTRALLLAFVLALGCDATPDPDPTDAGPTPVDAARPDAARPDAAVEVDAGESRPLIEVSHSRELRGVWLTTVYNLDFPSTSGMSADAIRAELDQVLDVAESIGLNAIFFQVRPESDAFYRSDLEPFSRFLTGTQGQDPGWDPLEEVIERSHARGIEVHAWMNPYRAKASSGSTAVHPHVSLTMPEHTIAYGGSLWLNPGAEVVRDHVVAVVRDVVSRYDVDGVHFDDYFYPYPQEGQSFDDAATYAAYQSAGGEMSLGDWRRENVHLLVRDVAAAIDEEAPWVRFGISPFGIYRPGMPEGIAGLDAYAAIYCDPMRWIDEGWVDYLAPQLYWPTTQTAQAYEPLVNWWAERGAARGRYTFAGNSIARLLAPHEWEPSEIVEQVRLSRAAAGSLSLGNIFFRMAMFRQNTSGIRDAFEAGVYPRPALPPPVANAPAGERPSAPFATPGAGTSVSIDHPGRANLRGFGLYREVDGAFVFEGLRRADTFELELASGRWAITAVDRFDRESLAEPLELP